MDGTGAVDWDAVRADYESGHQTIRQITTRHGITVDRLRVQKIRQGWTPRQHQRHAGSRRALIGRMLRLLDAQARQMETKLADDSNIDAAEMRLLETMTKTLDRLIALDNAEKKTRAPKKHADPEIAALRKKLTERILQFGQG